MNNADRKKLAASLARLGELKSELEAAKDAVRQLAEDESEKFDNLSEGLQSSEKGQAIEEAANTLDEIATALETAYDALEEAVGHDVP